MARLIWIWYTCSMFTPPLRDHILTLISNRFISTVPRKEKSSQSLLPRWRSLCIGSALKRWKQRWMLLKVKMPESFVISLQDSGLSCWREFPGALRAQCLPEPQQNLSGQGSDQISPAWAICQSWAGVELYWENLNVLGIFGTCDRFQPNTGWHKGLNCGGHERTERPARTAKWAGRDSYRMRCATKPYRLSIQSSDESRILYRQQNLDLRSHLRTAGKHCLKIIRAMVPLDRRAVQLSLEPAGIVQCGSGRTQA